MHLLITFFILIFAHLFFNMAHASPQAPANISLQQIDKKNTRNAEGRKRRLVKATSKKSQLKNTQKIKEKKKVKATAARTTAHPRQRVKLSQQSRHTSKIYLSSEKESFPASRPLSMNLEHRQRYQQAHDMVMQKLMNQLGKPYQSGGTSPDTGFDCSGLVWYAYKDLLKFRMPRTANEMYRLHDGTPVKRNALQKGDLVFFRIRGRGVADHVGVYLGNGRFIQSPRAGKEISISQLDEDYWQRHYLGARRMITPETLR